MSVAGTISNLAVAVGTLGLAGVTYSLVRKTSANVEATKNLAIEGMKARLDARAPHVTVLVQTPDWPPLEPSIMGRAGAPNPIVGQQFHTPVDGKKPIMIRASGSIINDGTTHARVMLYSGVELVTPLPEAGGGAYLVAPDETAPVVFQRERSVEQWITAHEQQEVAPPESQLDFQVSVFDTFDEGVADTIVVQIQAYPLVPVQGHGDTWQINNVVGAVPPAVLPYGSVVYPRERRYWSSISEQRPLGVNDAAG